MTTNARPSVASRGASLSSSPKLRPVLSVSSLSLFSALLRSYSGILASLFLALVLLVFKSELIGLVDHHIERISVQGELHKIDANQVSGQIAPWLESSFLTADLNEIKAQVDALAWVKSSTITRVWPGEILIGTVEQVPVAKWNSSSYISAEGEVFTPAKLDWSESLPALIGPANISVAQKLNALMQLSGLQALLAPHALSVVELALMERGVWEVTLGNGISVALGSPPFEEKVGRMVAVLDGASAENFERMQTIDTRYPNGLAIKWKTVTPSDGRATKK